MVQIFAAKKFNHNIGPCTRCSSDLLSVTPPDADFGFSGAFISSDTVPAIPGRRRRWRFKTALWGGCDDTWAKCKDTVEVNLLQACLTLPTHSYFPDLCMLFLQIWHFVRKSDFYSYFPDLWHLRKGLFPRGQLETSPALPPRHPRGKISSEKVLFYVCAYVLNWWWDYLFYNAHATTLEVAVINFL
jgi:hypothetical protein